MLLHLVGVSRNDDLVGTETESVFFLAGEVVKTTTCAPSAWANFTGHVTQPTQTYDANLLALSTPHAAAESK